jgi:hypothetical protein
MCGLAAQEAVVNERSLQQRRASAKGHAHGS